MKKFNGILMLVAVLLAVAAIVQIRTQLARSTSVGHLIADASQPGG